ncbi:MAG: DUF4143 domain-containing protein [bacterium]|nr:DUF4143 domain-containing protein [bacterium]
MAATQGSDYRPRVVDRQLERLLGQLPAVSIEGPRAVGKTWTARRWARTVYNLDDPPTLALVTADPHRLVSSEPPVLIDEWQRFPASWDLVRRAVDDDPSPGRFLLTGSAAPSSGPTHSGAGRIVTVRMRPMSLAERGTETPSVSLSDLLDGERPAITGQTSVGLGAYAHEIVVGGFPGLAGIEHEALTQALDGYLHRAVDHDVALMGHRVRNPATMRRWLTAYAAATATTASYETILDAATAGEADKPARSTTTAYRDLLEAMWLVEPVPAWQPMGNPLSRLKRGPKHHLADPCLAARLLKASEDSLLSGNASHAVPDMGSGSGLLLGALFESLVSLNVRVYAQAAGASVGHLRTWNDAHEVDLIVERANRVVAVEVKLTAAPDSGDTAQLRWLRDKLGPRLADSVQVTTGPYAYRDQDGIAIVPAALLGP